MRILPQFTMFDQTQNEEVLGDLERVNFQSKFHSGHGDGTYSNKDFVVELSVRIVSRERSEKNVILKSTKEQTPDP